MYVSVYFLNVVTTLLEIIAQLSISYLGEINNKYIVNSILLRNEIIINALTDVPNLICEVDICGSVGGWLSNFYDAFLATE